MKIPVMDYDSLQSARKCAENMDARLNCRIGDRLYVVYPGGRVVDVTGFKDRKIEKEMGYYDDD